MSALAELWSAVSPAGDPRNGPPSPTQSSKAHFWLARALAAEGALERAIDQARAALAQDATFLSARSKLAAWLIQSGRAAEARDEYQRLISAAPEDLAALVNLGCLLHADGQSEAAATLFRRALAVDPACAIARTNLSLTGHLASEGEIASSAGQNGLPSAATHPADLLWQIREAVVCPSVFNGAEEIDCWRNGQLTRLRSLRHGKYVLPPAEFVTAGVKPPTALIYQGRDDLPIKALFAELIRERLPPQPAPRIADRPSVGFVATPGNEGIFLRGMAGVLNQLRRSSLRVVVASGAAEIARIRGAVFNERIEYAQLPADCLAAARTLRDMRVDLLYHWEVGTDCLNYCLPFFRTAPLQCTSWGWPVTSGMPDMDYFISSAGLEPLAADSHYRERLVRLKHLPNYYGWPQVKPTPGMRERLNLPRGAHVYLCPQNPRKIHPDFDPIIADVLRRDPRGVFLYLASSRPEVSTALHRRLTGAMPDVAARVRVAPRMIKADYLGLVAAADVALDTPHYGGGANTTLDAIGLGVPIVTLPGAFHRSRYALAVYRQMEYEACVASSPREYAAQAVQLAVEPDYRRNVCRELLARRNVLFANPAGAEELHDFFQSAIQRVRDASAF